MHWITPGSCHDAHSAGQESEHSPCRIVPFVHQKLKRHTASRTMQFGEIAKDNGLLDDKNAIPALSSRSRAQTKWKRSASQPSFGGTARNMHRVTPGSCRNPNKACQRNEHPPSRFVPFVHHSPERHIASRTLHCTGTMTEHQQEATKPTPAYNGTGIPKEHRQRRQQIEIIACTQKNGLAGAVIVMHQRYGHRPNVLAREASRCSHRAGSIGRTKPTGH